MKTQPIPTTRTPVEYIPLPQDAPAHRVMRQAQIDAIKRDLEALKIKARDGKADSEPSDPAIAAQIAALQSTVDAETKALDGEVAAIQAKYPKPMAFTLKIPTSVEREQLQSKFVSIGLTQVTQDMMRAVLIEELFERDWGKGSTEANEIEAENIANFLDGVWQREEAQEIASARWREQEVERVMDGEAGAPVRPREDQPPKIVSVRDAAKTTRILADMMASSQKVRDIAARAADFSRRNAVALVRIHVLAARNVEVKDADGNTVSLAIAQDPYLKALPEEQADMLREAMDDASWGDLIRHLDRMYVLDGGEEKNSVSPLGKPFDLTGSHAPIGDMVSSDGSSTNSSTTPAPAAASETITALSSGSPSDSALDPPKAESISSPTVEA